MNILAINTVGRACEAAVISAGVEHVVKEEMARGHDARIAPVVERAMQNAALGWGDLSRIAVVTGPGSFTGIRVGVAFARGLSLALKVPVAGLTALEALGCTHAGKVLAVLPAQRRPPERTWWAQVLIAGRGAEPPVEIDEQQIAARAGEMDAIVGDSPPECVLADFEPLTPDALAAARLCARIEMETAPARPVYVRAPDAAPMRPVKLETRD